MKKKKKNRPPFNVRSVLLSRLRRREERAIVAEWLRHIAKVLEAGTR